MSIHGDRRAVGSIAGQNVTLRERSPHFESPVDSIEFYAGNESVTLTRVQALAFASLVALAFEPVHADACPDRIRCWSDGKTWVAISGEPSDGRVSYLPDHGIPSEAAMVVAQLQADYPDLLDPRVKVHVFREHEPIPYIMGAFDEDSECVDVQIGNEPIEVAQALADRAPKGDEFSRRIFFLGDCGEDERNGILRVLSERKASASAA